MKRLHIFNPEHDIALAANLSNYTAPHAGRQLRRDLGFLPLLWADADDAVLVDDAEWARAVAARLFRKLPGVATSSRLHDYSERITQTLKGIGGQIDGIDPWGWDAALRATLLRKGVDEQLLPTPSEIDEVRRLSHRRVAADLLSRLRIAGTIGESTECASVSEVRQLLSLHRHLVLKAPWSSSGRGLRFLSEEQPAMHDNWMRNILLSQGSVMAEPYYHKVKDFGMEFCSDGSGSISYQGLSLFHTKNGAYTGNLLATERFKEKVISIYLPTQLLTGIQDLICRELSTVFAHHYQGPFGIDMMVVANASGLGFLLHPCVEINLRRTMGHVALSLNQLLNPSADDEKMKVMRIIYEDNNYKIKIQRL